jgi:hypothetical protein
MQDDVNEKPDAEKVQLELELLDAEEKKREERRQRVADWSRTLDSRTNSHNPFLD